MRYLAAAVVLLGLLVLGCVEQRTGVSHNELPGPVLRTIERSAPGTIGTVIRETRGDRVVYKAKVSSGEKRYDVVVDGQGELVSKKER